VLFSFAPDYSLGLRAGPLRAAGGCARVGREALGSGAHRALRKRRTFRTSRACAVPSARGLTAASDSTLGFAHHPCHSRTARRIAIYFKKLSVRSRPSAAQGLAGAKVRIEGK
jgi:hypothetical protein